MSFATVMVHVDVDGGSDARIRLAKALADRFGSVLIGVAGLAPLPPPVESGDLAGGELVEDELEDIADALKKCGERFRAAVAAPPSRVEWRSAADFPTAVLAQEARAADLLIVGRDRASRNSYRSLDPGGAILQAGRPVLVVPGGIESLQAEHILIGWKDTREARRAVQDAMPFLHEAGRVTIVEICDEGMEEPARQHVDDVARYLARHRIDVARRAVVHSGQSAAQELIRLSKDESADLIVGGAYGHSRLGEWIFGGVTRDLLASCPVCCLFAH